MLTALALLLALPLCADTSPTAAALEARGAMPLPATISPAAKAGVSLVPAYSYDEKLGHLFGAACFLYLDCEPGYNVDLAVVSNGSTAHEFWLHPQLRFAGGWRAEGLADIERYFDWYYGEGDRAPLSNPRRVSVDLAHLMARGLAPLAWGLKAGPEAHWRTWRERALERRDATVAGDPASLFGPEDTLSLGAVLQHDTRDSQMAPAAGHFMEATARRLLSGSWQAQADLRGYLPLLPRTTLASRAWGGTSWAGEPGYPWRYRLGGYQLRGFGDNRMRGRQFWVWQEEIRVTVWRWIGAVAAVEWGDAADEELTAPRASGLAGLRIGIPPDMGMKARIDMGFSSEGTQVMVDFGEAF